MSKTLNHLFCVVSICPVLSLIFFGAPPKENLYLSIQEKLIEHGWRGGEAAGVGSPPSAKRWQICAFSKTSYKSEFPPFIKIKAIKIMKIVKVNKIVRISIISIFLGHNSLRYFK